MQKKIELIKQEVKLFIQSHVTLTDKVNKKGDERNEMNENYSIFLHIHSE